MLQRAASNAYSWWWAGHIRTKQSKWLEQSLQDMGDKVQNMLKLIEEDGDSFAKRAEMYYKRRPELINFVEESYRAYRALAERYDHISTELQNANNTIATVFPERVQFSMDDDEDDDFGSSKPPKPLTQAPPIPNAPKVPDFPNQDLKGIVASATKKIQPKRSLDPESPKKSVPKSGLSKVEALEEIDNNQKEILALQTVKEFIKSSYENGVTKYWEIENRIGQLQERINNLQDEFEIGKAIEDNEARTIMAKAALQTCEETLTKLEEKQERAEKEAKVEYERVEDAGLRIKSLKLELLPGEQDNSDSKVEVQKRPERAEELQVKIMEHFDAGPKNSKDSKEVLTVTQLVVKIDELVTKVISLETAVSSQTAAADRLRTETDDLHQQIYTLEHVKATLLKENKDLINRLREMEEKLERLQDLNYDLQIQNKDLKKHFTEAHSTLQDLSGKLHSVKPDEEIEITESMPEEESSSTGTKTPEEVEKQEDLQVPREASKKWKGLRLAVGGDKKKKVTILEKQEDPNSQEKDDKQDVVNNEQKKVAKGKDHEMNWQEMLLDGVEDKEKILLKEYTTILRNYKDLKKKHSENENRSRDALFETAMRVRELKTIITKRDEEIHSLRQKLELLQESSEGNNENKPVSIMSNDQSATKPDATEDKPKENKTSEIPSTEEEGKDFKLVLVEQPQPISPVEEKLRTKIDALLDENLDFWLRFSDAFHQVQKFRSAFQDLQAETERKGKDESKEASDTADIKSDLRPIYKHITEIQTELTVWIEKSTLLKEELQGRFSSLCDIQEEMTKALTADAEEEMKFTSHMAAKFQGEVLNMKQENNKVRDELQAAFDHVTALRQEIEKTLKKLSEEFKLSESKKNSQPQSKSSSSGNRVPLRSFIFGTKQKKRSFFSYIHHKRSHGDRSGLPM